MKTNEAPENMYIPEKIYLPYKDGKVIGLVKETGVPYKSGVDGNIEYTRTEAFIEKACDAYCAVCDTKECQGCAECSWVIKFRKQIMKIL